MPKKIILLQSSVTLEQAYFLNKQGYIFIPDIDKFENKIITITKEA